MASFKIHAKDTGSSVVQIALLTERINHLNKHFVSFPKDYASRTGLMKLVGRRRDLLEYVKRYDVQQYQNILDRLSLRR